jgi:hypothetical protein
MQLQHLSISYITGTLQVASFGGGPGTDASGLVWVKRKLLKSTSIASINCQLLDYEKSWKRYTSILQSIFEPDVSISFSPCDVTAGIGEGYMNREVTFGEYDMMIFAYVAHETSAMSKKMGYLFYKDLAANCKNGSLCIFLDVMGHSSCVFEEIFMAMSTVEGVTLDMIQRVSGDGSSDSCKSEVMVFSISK